MYDTARIAAYWQDSADASTTKAKGDALEDLIEYVFGEIPGLVLPTRNSRDPGGVAEIDVAFWNDGHDDGLRQFDRLIAIECKNWDTAVGYAEIVLFKEKLRARGQTLGCDDRRLRYYRHLYGANGRISRSLRGASVGPDDHCRDTSGH